MKRKVRNIIRLCRRLDRWLPALLLPLLCSCDVGEERLPEHEFVGSSMGTIFSVKVVAPPSDIDTTALQWQIEDLLSGIERAMSTYLAESELSRFNNSRSTDWFETSHELCEAIAAAQLISAYTGGVFDITVGPLVNLWGFGPTGAVTEPPDHDDIAEAVASIGHSRLQADCTIPALRKDLPALYVDLSAFAKGYAVDRISVMLDDQGFADYLVELGGELRIRGNNSKSERWAIAVEKPIQSGRSMQSIISLTDTALATSGDYRNYFEHGGVRYSHTIDPRTGFPVSHSAASVTVLADTAAFADAVATALLVLGPSDGLAFAERENIAAIFLLRSGTGIEERMTSVFAAQLEP